MSAPPAVHRADFFQSILRALESKHLMRALTRVDRIDATTADVEGKRCTLFCLNDYLGLSHHPILQLAATEAIEKYGVGAGASRLICGHSSFYAQLEGRLATFKATPSAIVFSSGYMTNMGALPALIQREDLILSDRLNHASLTAGAVASGGQLKRYRHGDMEQLKRWLSGRGASQRAWIVTDGVFSMDGDIVSLPDIVRLAEEYDAMIYLDDAHGTGVIGDCGRGTCSYFNIKNPRIIQMGTLSKALGGMGGFVATDSLHVQYLLNRAGTFIYTTALPPSVLATALAGLDLITADDTLRQHLQKMIRRVRLALIDVGFDIEPPARESSAIIALRVGDSNRALHLSKKLLDAGIYIPAVRPPTVPNGTSRLRITLMATHTEGQITDLITNLLRIVQG